jgi:metal-sulfur cluster biosynthetic enzyme
MTSPHHPLLWSIQTTHPDQVEPLKDALREVVDPELGLNIIELGLVRQVEFKDDETAHIKMILTTPFCPYAPAMIDATRKTAEKHLKYVTTIELSMEMWDPSFMEEGAGEDWGLF